MKPLLLSFFAAILCYALFFERKDTPVHIDEIQYTIQTEAFDSLQVLNPVFLYTENINGLDSEFRMEY
jgi:hypothetical protein